MSDNSDKHTTSDTLMGIMFNEPAKGSDHTPPPSTPAVPAPSKKTESAFDVTRAYENEHIEIGTIVSDRKHRHPSFGESVGAAFSEWWGKTKHNVSQASAGMTRITAEAEQPLVEDANARKEIIKKAASHAALAPKDDHHAVVEKVRTFAKDSKRITGSPTIVKEHGSAPAGAWTHTEDNPQTPPPAPLTAPIPDFRNVMIAPVIGAHIKKDIEEYAPAHMDRRIEQPDATPDEKRVVVEKLAHMHIPEAVSHIATPTPTHPSHAPAPVITKPAKAHKEESAWTHFISPTPEEHTIKPTISPTPSTTGTIRPREDKPLPKPAGIADFFVATKSSTTVHAPAVPTSTPTRSDVASPYVTPIANTTATPPPAPKPHPAQTPIAVVTPTQSPTPVASAPAIQNRISVEEADQSSTSVLPQSEHARIPASLSEVIAQRVAERNAAYPANVSRSIAPAQPAHPSDPHTIHASPTDRITHESVAFHDTSVPDLAPTYTRSVQPETAHSTARSMSQQQQSTSPVSQIEHPALRTTLRWGIIGGIAAFGATAAIILSIYINVFDSAPKEDVAKEARIIPSLMKTDAQIPFQLLGARSEFLPALATELTNAPFGLTHIYLVAPKETGEHVVTTAEFLTHIEAHLDQKTLHALSDAFMLGSITTTKNEPYLIVTGPDFDTLFAGFLRWEPNMRDDLAPMFGSTQLPFSYFRDAVRNNASTRILYDEAGNEILLYSFVNEHTVIITSSGEALSKIISRMKAR